LEEAIKQATGPQQNSTPSSTSRQPELLQASPPKPRLEDPLSAALSSTTATATATIAETILQEINQKKKQIAAAAAAAAQELHMLEAAAVAAGILTPPKPSTVQEPVQMIPTAVQEPVQLFPTVAEPQLSQAAQEPALLPQAPTAAAAVHIQPAPSAAAAAVLPSVQKPVQIPTAAEPQLSQAAQEPALLPQAPTAAAANYSLDFLRPQADSDGVQLDTALSESLARFKLDDKLLSTKLGIAGLADLYRVTIGLHDDLSETLADPNEQGPNLRKEFSRFYFSFMGLKDCSPETAAAVTMLHASKASQGFKLRVNQALQAGIGIPRDQIQAQATNAARSGKLPNRKASYKQMDLLSNGDWMGLLGLTVELLCHDSNKPLTFENKRQELLSADLKQFDRCSEALAHVLQLYQAATTAYGSEFMTNYDLLKLIVSKLCSKVQYEIAEVIATNKTLDLINMDWRGIDSIVTDAWDIVSRRPASYYSKLDLVPYTSGQAAADAAAPFTNHAAITQATAMCTNKTLKCQRFNEDGSACNEEFVWTAEEQMLHKRLGYTSTPKSCPKHKQPPRHYASDKCPKITSGAPAECGNAGVEKCRLFQAGKCGFGDQ
jgi:hypothetical protein